MLRSILLHRYERVYGSGCRATGWGGGGVYIKHSQAEVCHFTEFLPASLVNGRYILWYLQLQNSIFFICFSVVLEVACTCITELSISVSSSTWNMEQSDME